jgi:phospholipid/cholesterol/gamma-HCH transport system substrate-binding protein
MMSRELKVGLFVIFGLSLTMLAIFLVGDIRRLWDRKVEYGTAFEDVAGLKPGAPVRMGGLDIGTVTRVGHDRDLGDTRIYVRMSIIKREAARIRADSVAHVVNKGLLGDKMVELTVGAPQKLQLPEESLIPSEEPEDMFAAANKLAASTEKAISELQPLARALGDPKLAEDIKGAAADVHAMLDATAHGDGIMHRIFFDRREAERVDELIAHLNQVSGRLDSTIADVQDVTAHVRQGPGIVHALVYDGEISKGVGGSVHELHEDLRAIREGNGLAHALLYGDTSSQHVMSNLNSMSDDLRAVVAGLREGKGTLGALLVDPTVYEDIKSIVGNVERNEVLRALVRYSIKADERRSGVRVKPAGQ